MICGPRLRTPKLSRITTSKASMISEIPVSGAVLQAAVRVANGAPSADTRDPAILERQIRPRVHASLFLIRSGFGTGAVPEEYTGQIAIAYDP